MEKRDWSIAIRLGNEMVDLINKELGAMRERDKVEPLQLLAATMLALVSVAETSPPDITPQMLRELFVATAQMLDAFGIRVYVEQKKPKPN